MNKTKTGKYIVIEGHDGTGKSTQVSLLRAKLDSIGIDSIEFHEPAGSPIADEIRNILKNGSLKRDAMTDLLLFSAARHDIWNTRALPALILGKWVIASRNYYSTLAYQGYGGGLDIITIKNVTKYATGKQYMNPDASIILDINDENERTRRIGFRGELEKPDTFESRGGDYQSRVRLGYGTISQDYNIPIISADGTPETVHNNIWKILSKSLF